MLAQSMPIHAVSNISVGGRGDRAGDASETGGVGTGGGGPIYLKHTVSSVGMGEMVEIGGGSRAGSDGGRRSEAALSKHPSDLRQLSSGDPAHRFS